MHVGFSLLTLFPGRVGGSETNVRGLLGEYSAGNGPDRVTVLANRYVMQSYSNFAGPVALHHVRSYRPGDSDLTRFLAMQSARLLPERAAREVPPGVDLVHFPVTVPIPRVELPTVVTLFDVQHHDMPHQFSRAERWHRRWAYDEAARNATRVVTSSEYSRGSLVEHTGVDRARVEVIPLGIDHDRFNQEPGTGDAGLDLPERFIVYPANLWPHKNHRRLIEALAQAEDRGLSLILTGQADARLRPLLALARKLGVEHRVRHLGYVAGEQMPELYRRAVALVFPSLFEGFGSPPLEAMACGCPVASSNAASLEELCEGAALLFDPQDTDAIAAAIGRIAADPSLRTKLRERGLVRAREYTWGSAAARHLDVYRQALMLGR